MSRHIADKRGPSDGGRMKNFLAVEKSTGDEGSHPSAKALLKRTKKHDDAARVKQFLRIERGREA